MNLYVNYPSWLSPYPFKSFPTVRWYGLMYVVAFAVAFALFRREAIKNDRYNLKVAGKTDEAADAFFWMMIGLLLGARLGSALIYSGDWYWKHPWLIFWPFSNGKFVGLPGMSYHGGVVGTVLGLVFYCKAKHKKFFPICDLIVCCIPFGYFFGRLGNFTNGELWGRVTASPIGMIFPDAPLFSVTIGWVRELAEKVGMNINGVTMVNLPRHPSQLYEAFFEGIVVGLFMWFYVRPRLGKKGPGYGFAWYLIGYGLVRFVIEYFREPDQNMGYIIKGGGNPENTALFTSVFNISMGQILCLLMIAVGGVLMYYQSRRIANG